MPKAVAIAMLSMAFVAAGTSMGQLHADDAAQASAEWLHQDYPYLAVDQTLPDALREFGHNLDLSVDVSAGVKGRVRHHQNEGSAGDFLNYLASEHRLDWILDKGRLYISSEDEKTARSWPASATVFENARTALASAGLNDPRFAIGFDSGRGLINLFAPPRYVILASPVIDSVLTPKSARTVNIIHGRSATGGT
jgi:type III secretion protein C